MSNYNPRDWFWQIGEDDSQFWSSAARAYKVADSAAYLDWYRTGKRPTRIASEAELWETLRVQAPSGLPPTDYWYVPVPLVRQRLEAAGLWQTLSGVLSQNPAAMLKVLSLEQGVQSNDAEARAMLSAVGADPDSILAPPG